jgi:exodeoxyribonuclease VII small subunit
MRYFLTFAETPRADSRFRAPDMVKPTRNPLPASFEAALGELESIVRDMETQQLPLEESLAAYERGAALLKYCQEALGAAEQKLQILENGGLREFAPDAGNRHDDN